MVRPYLFASQIAAAAGMNPYKKAHHVMEELWKRECPVSYKAAFEGASEKGHPDEVAAAVTLVEGGAALCDKAISHGNTAKTAEMVGESIASCTTGVERNIADLQTKLDNLQVDDISQARKALKDVNKEVAVAAAAAVAAVSNATRTGAAADTMILKAAECARGRQKQAKVKVAALESTDAGAEFVKVDKQLQATQKVAEELKKAVRTTFGTAREADVVTRYEASAGVKVLRDTKCYSKDLDGIDARFGGRVDGLIAGDCVLEIKNRVSRLFTSVPLYEMVQVQAYMELLDRPRAILLQCLRKGGEVCLQSTEISRDRKMWKGTVLPRLAAFVAALEAVASDPLTTGKGYAELDDEARDAFLDAFCNEGGDGI